MLSGGEAQRLKLARALSEPAKGALFILDEPSAGLHAEDTGHVIDAMRALVRDGATVLVVAARSGRGARPRIGSSISAQGVGPERRPDRRGGDAWRT